MAKERENPYGSFNFLVDFSTGEAETTRGGFQEIGGINIETTTMEYRAGNSRNNHRSRSMGSTRSAT